MDTEGESMFSDIMEAYDLTQSPQIDGEKKSCPSARRESPTMPLKVPVGNSTSGCDPCTSNTDFIGERSSLTTVKASLATSGQSTRNEGCFTDQPCRDTLKVR